MMPRPPVQRKLTLMLAVVVALIFTLLGTAYAEEQAVPVANAVTGLALGPEPVTVTLMRQPRPAPTAEGQEYGPTALAVEGIEGTLTQPVRINVFIDKPDANSRTPVKDPHFLGYIYIAPRNGIVKGVGRAFDLSMVEALDRDTLRVTLVPVAGINAPPHDAQLQVSHIYIRRET
jgi:hypothetical protein